MTPTDDSSSEETDQASDSGEKAKDSQQADNTEEPESFIEYDLDDLDSFDDDEEEEELIDDDDDEEPLTDGLEEEGEPRIDDLGEEPEISSPQAEDQPEEEAADSEQDDSPQDEPSSLATASAEDCYEEAKLLLEGGNKSLALQLLQVAIAKDPTNATYREALAEVREMRAEQGHQKEKEIRAREKLNRDLEEAPVSPPPRAADDKGPSQRHVIKAAAALVLTIVAAVNTAWVFGVFEKPLERPAVDATPYMNISLVVEQATEGPVPTDLILHVATDWKTKPDKLVLVKSLAAEASAQGFSAVTLLDDEGRKVASTRNHGKIVQLY